MPKTYVPATQAEIAAMQRLQERIGFAPTVLYGRGTNGQLLKRITEHDNVVYALVPDLQANANGNGTRSYSLVVTALYHNAVHPNGVSRQKLAWTPERRAEASARMKARYANRK